MASSVKIRIDMVRVSGFRGIRNLEMNLPRIAILIGPNNSGKTSLLKAMQLALGDYSRALSEDDFYIGADQKAVKEIIVDIRIVPTVDGLRSKTFTDDWASEFEDKIKAEANLNQFLAVRTRASLNTVKGGFDVERSTLERWPDTANWATEKVKETRLSGKYDSLPFLAIEAQRDIHQELREKHSFVGRVLAGIDYDLGDVEALEDLIRELNEQAVSKSKDLDSLKNHLAELSKSFLGAGSAELTPFPKKIRDLCKNFSVHFGDSAATTFSMEYHGMGTRSWASLLTVKAFISLMADAHESEEEVYFPIIATEEPEAHLHPNAQRTLYQQLAESNGQILISTHSPYLAAMAQCHELRSFKRSGNRVDVFCLPHPLDPESERRLRREIIHSRGEILFSRAIVLCEGETEEQALPLLFQKYFQVDPFVLGINFVGVGGSGKRYSPFLKFSNSLRIPVFVFSDGESAAKKGLKKYYEEVFGPTDLDSCPFITVLNDTDFEGYLVGSGFIESIKSAIEECDGVNSVEAWIEKKHGTSLRRILSSAPPCATCKQGIYTENLRDFKCPGGYENGLLEMARDGKTTYAPKIAAELCKFEANALPPKIVEFFEKIKAGLSL